MERGENMGVLVWHLLPAAHLLTPDSSWYGSPSLPGWYAQPGQVPKAANFSFLKTKWAYSVFHQCVIWPPSLSPILTGRHHSTYRSLQSSPSKPWMIASKTCHYWTLTCLSCLQNVMSVGMITASQGGTCAIILRECFVFIPDESSLLNHMKTQVNALSDLTPSLGDFVNQWFGSWDSW